MHLEFLIEDVSGRKALETLVPKIISAPHTFRIHSYKGVGHIPRNMRDTENASRRILLESLPKLLKGYGRTYAGYPDTTRAAVILVCDLDDKPLQAFLEDLKSILNCCNPAPTTAFCLAIEEGEAWLLGDPKAVKAAYPNAKDDILASYVQDSICGTWEKLADAIYPGGENALSKKGWQGVGAEKSRWAENITPKMDVNDNRSPSFAFFRDTMLGLAE